MNKEIKYYTSSDGIKIPLKDVHFTRLSNGLAKRYREVFEAIDEDDFNNKLNDINDIKEEIYARINKFHDDKFKKGE